MRFIIDECIGPSVAEWLRKQKYEVFSVYEEARGIEDDAIIQKASEEDWILITNDKDFGEKAYRYKHSHKGIILLRLKDERRKNKISILRQLLEKYADKLSDYFVVVTERKVRFIQTQS